MTPAQGDQETIIGPCDCCALVECCLRYLPSVFVRLQSSGSPFIPFNDTTIKLNITDPLGTFFNYPGTMLFLNVTGGWLDDDGILICCYSFFVPIQIICESGGKYKFSIGNPLSVPSDETDPTSPCTIVPATYVFTQLVLNDADDIQVFTQCLHFHDFDFFLNTPGLNEGNSCGAFYWSIYESRSSGLTACDTETATITVPGEWFTVLRPASSSPGDDLVPPDFDLHMTIYTDPDTPFDIEFTPEVVSGSPIGQTVTLQSSVEILSTVCFCNSTTSTSTTTTTSSTSSTTTTSSTSSSSTSSTSSSTPPPPPDDSRHFCCPDGTPYEQVQVTLFVEPSGAGQACANCPTWFYAVWNAAKNAYVADFFSCGDQFMYGSVYCLPDGSGGGTWYAEIRCGGADGPVMCTALLHDLSDGGLCNPDDAQMAGNDFSANSTPCCLSITSATISVGGVSGGGPPA